MRKTRILAIAPYEGLRELLLTEASRHDEIEMDVYVGDLENGVAIAKALEDSGYDVILSRGGTAWLIAKSVRLPVVDASPTIYDLLRFVRMAENTSARFAVVGFSNITHVADKLFALIEHKIDIVTVQSPAHVDTVISSLAADQVTLVVGDASAVAAAKKFHINNLLIASGEESVQAALNEAVRIRRFIDQAVSRNSLYRGILENSHLSVAVFDEERQLLYSNLSQDQLEFQRVFRALPEYVPAVLEQGEIRLTRYNKGYLFEIVGRKPQRAQERIVVFYIERHLSIPQVKAGVMRYYHLLDVNREEDFGPIDNVGRMADTLENAQRVGKTNAPVCVVGEMGTPFDTVMYTLYHESKLSVNALLMIDCSLIDAKSFQWLLENEDSPLCETRLTLCFKHFSALSEALQTRYIHFATCTSLHKRNRIIYGLDEVECLCKTAIEFFNGADLFFLHLPPLRERAGDIPILANLYLSAANFETGRQVIGFSEEARALLRAYSWPGNNDQLRRVIRGCLTHAREDTIQAQDVQECIDEEKRAFQRGGAPGIDLTGTLEEINLRIVNAVMREEGMNRSRVAERLCISRSTLWRMLREP